MKFKRLLSMAGGACVGVLIVTLCVGANNWYDPFLNKWVAMFRGASAGAAGSPGYVPQPAAGEQDYYLRGDGTWAAIGATGMLTIQGETPLAFDGATDDSYHLFVRLNADPTSNHVVVFPVDTTGYVPLSAAYCTDIAGGDLTITGGVLNVDDSYLRNTGDTSSGDYTNTGRWLFESPLAAEFGVSTTVTGKVGFHSAGGAAYMATLAATTMTGNADFLLPAALPGAESFLKMGTDGVIDYDTSTYLTAPIMASQAEITEIGTATYDDLQDMLNQVGSAGKISGFAVTDSGGGEIDVAAGTALLRTTNDSNGSLVSCNYAGTTNVALTPNVVNWVYLAYNAGTPAVAVTTTFADVDLQTEIMLGRAYYDGATMTVLSVGQNINDITRKDCLRLFEERGFEQASGGTLGETGTRNPTVSAGVFYCGHNRITTSAIDCSGAGTFSIWNSSASTTADATAQTDYNATQYWTGAALDTLTNNRYGTRFFYLDKGGALHMQYGTSNSVSVAAALDEAVPTPPGFLTGFAAYIGRVVVKKSETSAADLTSAFTQVESGQTVTNHNNLANIQGGAAADYYHLTSAQHTVATDDDITDLADGSLTGSKVAAATTDAQGAVELATAAEVTTGTATDRAVTPDGLAGSDYGKRTFVFALCGSGTALAVADGTLGLVVPAIYAGYNLVDAEVACHTKGVTNTTDIQLRRRRAGADADMLTVKLTLGDEYYVSDETINTGNDDLAAGDLIYIDVDAVHDTPPQGVTVIFTVQLP